MLGQESLNQPHSEALSEAILATKRGPYNSQAWFKLGLCYEQEQSPEEAFDCYKKAAKIDPNFAPYWQKLAYFLSQCDIIVNEKLAAQCRANVLKVEKGEAPIPLPTQNFNNLSSVPFEEGIERPNLTQRLPNGELALLDFVKKHLIIQNKSILCIQEPLLNLLKDLKIEQGIDLAKCIATKKDHELTFVLIQMMEYFYDSVCKNAGRIEALYSVPVFQHLRNLLTKFLLTFDQHQWEMMELTKPQTEWKISPFIQLQRIYLNYSASPHTLRCFEDILNAIPSKQWEQLYFQELPQEEISPSNAHVLLMNVAQMVIRWNFSEVKGERNGATALFRSILKRLSLQQWAGLSKSNIQAITMGCEKKEDNIEKALRYTCTDTWRDYFISLGQFESEGKEIQKHEVSIHYLFEMACIAIENGYEEALIVLSKTLRELGDRDLGAQAMELMRAYLTKVNNGMNEWESEYYFCKENGGDAQLRKANLTRAFSAIANVNTQNEKSIVMRNQILTAYFYGQSQQDIATGNKVFHAPWYVADAHPLVREFVDASPLEHFSALQETKKENARLKQKLAELEEKQDKQKKAKLRRSG